MTDKIENVDDYAKGYRDRNDGKLCEEGEPPYQSKDYTRGYSLAHQRKMMLKDLSVMDRNLGITK